MKFLWVPFVLAALGCAPPSAGLQEHIGAGQSLLAKGDFAGAEREFHEAESEIPNAPNEDGVRAIEDGLTRVETALIQLEVEKAERSVGDDLDVMEELHKMQLRLRSIGGNREVEATIARALNIRAALLLAPHEATEELTDLSTVLKLGRFPQLTKDTRRRLLELSAKSWRVLNQRAVESRHEVVRRVFAGLAAHYSGAATTSATTLRDSEVAKYSRGTAVAVELASAEQLNTAMEARGASKSAEQALAIESLLPWEAALATQPPGEPMASGA